MLNAKQKISSPAKAAAGRQNIEYKLKGFTLIELVTVLVVIGVLAGLALPQFSVTRERALDKDAKSNVSLIQAAEKIYRMERSTYYPDPVGSTGNISNINEYLKLSLSDAASPTWVYNINSATQRITATRNIAGGRVWTITPFTSDIPLCTAGGSDPCP